MYVIKFAFLFILVVNIMCFDRNITKLFNFLSLSFEGGGGSKRKLRELKFLSDINILTSPITYDRSFFMIGLTFHGMGLNVFLFV